ncbi:MAG: pilus assembly protein CpaE [Roseobacter sp.]|jgi:pilus assembly protein CpaE|uniref:Pilus assembly protein CpaE n=2 Tax=Sulfitobacter TaxID=60136 RepID=A0A1H2Y068_9RHOB|nr:MULTISPECIES: AAA family ATPase [Sulfitobacter]MAN10185.1 pilus assembly protein CpaE [Roseobacter sp.]HBU56028.1 pilus assembly protein CpaE [Sulfitobacter sp.]MBG62266.1 pilus assembly protein CpaE [Roseobacter sp.]OAN81125.1 pilus assembly protein CpaE [Sulfitobacter pontiacus]QPO09480.1 AAA family ATPase [Sulfitobacter sp. B30-2]
MSSSMPQIDAPQIIACTVSRDVQNFDLLIEDMESALGEAWGDLGFSESLAFFSQPEAATLELIALALDSEDEENLPMMSEIISQAKSRHIKVILIAEDMSPASLHSLLRQGADEFVPYPLPEGELAATIERLRAGPEPTAEHIEAGPKLKPGADKDGAVIVVHGLAGGTGATSMAVNLAWELATSDKKNPPKVCLLDFDLQFGAVATYLDLPRREVVYDMLIETDEMDEESFGQALLTYEDTLQVLTAPADMLPLDLITSEDVTRILDMARNQFDYVVVDMPSTLVQWTETVLSNAHVYFAMLELDMRCAQNALRFKRALQSEELPVEKLRYVMNRAPKFTDLNAKARVKRMAESLGISIDVQLPDGGKQVTQANDHGLPLANTAAKNPLRREIAKLASSIHDLKADEAKAA